MMGARVPITYACVHYHLAGKLVTIRNRPFRLLFCIFNNYTKTTATIKQYMQTPRSRLMFSNDSSFHNIRHIKTLEAVHRRAGGSNYSLSFWLPWHWDTLSEEVMESLNGTQLIIFTDYILSNFFLQHSYTN